jgi:hypothetical protein
MQSVDYVSLRYFAYVWLLVLHIVCLCVFDVYVYVTINDVLTYWHGVAK